MWACCAASLAAVAAGDRITLTDGWAIGSSADVSGEGAKISLVGYKTSLKDWHHIAKVPSTVLGALLDKGVYQDLGYDENLKNVEVEPFLPTWWYRTEFKLPGSALAHSSADVSETFADRGFCCWSPEYLDPSGCNSCGEKHYDIKEEDCNTENTWCPGDEPTPTPSPQPTPVPGPTPSPTPHAKRMRLVFKGINYRANIWLNGERLAQNDTIMGTFRYFDLDISDFAQESNALAVEVTRPYNGLVGLSSSQSQGDVDPRCPAGHEGACLDLAITWVDWAPTPPDFNMGLYGPVDLEVTGPVSVAFPMAETTVDGDGVRVKISAQVKNWDPQAQTGALEGTLGNATLTCKPVSIAAGESLLAECEVLSLGRDALWWPWQMGPARLHKLSLAFRVASAAAPSDSLTQRIGLRQSSKVIDARGNALFSVNGERILIRGGGWAPDLFQRMTRERHVQELEYVKHLGLNTVRLEGKLENDDFLQLADEMGILIMPGWCCCDSWQAWNMWGDDQRLVAQESMRTQARRLRSFASVFVFVYSSDDIPPTSVEEMYLRVLEDEQWSIPTLSAASAGTSKVSGPTGVKMSGPYAYVVPGYWSDPNASSNELGGAFGFNTETSIGAAIMPLESVERTTPASKRWPVSSEAWAYHTGASTGAFHGFQHFTPDLNGRLGEAGSYQEYVERAQLMVYEGHRAMFEAYSASKYTATGVVQWMLNSAFPSHVWHLYDWYLNPAGAYFGAKKGLEPLHIQWDYATSSVWVVNSEYTAAGPLEATAELRDLDGALVDAKQVALTELAADGTKELFSWPLPSSSDGPQLLRLTLAHETRNGSDALVSRNVYWLRPSMDVVDWNSCGWFRCSTKKFADLTALTSMPAASVDAQLSSDVQNDEWSEANVKLSNDGSTVAFFTRLRLLKSDGSDVLPVLWSDNYVTLFAGEKMELTARFRTKDGPAMSIDVVPFGSVPSSTVV